MTIMSSRESSSKVLSISPPASSSSSPIQLMSPRSAIDVDAMTPNERLATLKNLKMSSDHNRSERKQKKRDKKKKKTTTTTTTTTKKSNNNGKSDSKKKNRKKRDSTTSSSSKTNTKKPSSSASSSKTKSSSKKPSSSRSSSGSSPASTKKPTIGGKTKPLFRLVSSPTRPSYTTDDIIAASTKRSEKMRDEIEDTLRRIVKCNRLTAQDKQALKRQHDTFKKGWRGHLENEILPTTAAANALNLSNHGRSSSDHNTNRHQSPHRRRHQSPHRRQQQQQQRHQSPQQQQQHRRSQSPKPGRISNKRLDTTQTQIQSMRDANSRLRQEMEFLQKEMETLEVSSRRLKSVNEMKSATANDLLHADIARLEQTEQKLQTKLEMAKTHEAKFKRDTEKGIHHYKVEHNCCKAYERSIIKILERASGGKDNNNNNKLAQELVRIANEGSDEVLELRTKELAERGLKVPEPTRFNATTIMNIGKNSKRGGKSSTTGGGGGGGSFVSIFASTKSNKDDNDNDDSSSTSSSSCSFWSDSSSSSDDSSSSSDSDSDDSYSSDSDSDSSDDGAYVWK